MFRQTFTGLNKQSLRRWLIVFFLALAIPTAILIQQSSSQLKWETFHQHQLLADELAVRIDEQFLQLINTESQRPFTDYSFLNVAGDPAANFFQRSPLSRYPIEVTVPGMVGYFQVDSLGKLMTPLLPELVEQASGYGISDEELTARISLQDEIQSVLNQNRLVQKKPVSETKFNKDKSSDIQDHEQDRAFSDVIESASGISSSIELEEAPEDYSYRGQTVFDELNRSVPNKSKAASKLGRIEDLQLEQRYQVEQELLEAKQRKEQVKKKETQARTEFNVLPELAGKMQEKFDTDSTDKNAPFVASPAEQPDLALPRIRTFESEVDPFEFSQLDSGHFVLFRKVWLNDQRYIQGMLIDQQAFLAQIVNTAFRQTSLSQMSNLLVVYQGNVLEAFTSKTLRGYLSSSRDLSGEILYQTKLSDPLSDMQLLFSITELPAGPGGTVILWLALILTFVLCGGLYLMYRLGLGQINLANQQQDFVSAVSHELKTPLTSIRMYGEMLREGWASEDKKKTYYDFIYDESERLSRLINNVLLMAKLTRNKQQVELKKLTVAELLDGVQSKVSTQIERAGFELKLISDDGMGQEILNVDADWFAQIMINLVDNAIKFSAKADTKTIVLGCQKQSNGQVQFTVRDYGPGIMKEQMKKIFKLFYRSENELTRETVGTGIGLALVHQMVMGMNGLIDVVNVEPGVEFRVSFATK